MRALGYEREAAAIVASLERAAVCHGFREYYNPLTGRGLAARHFGFATLLVDLAFETAAGDGVEPSGAASIITHQWPSP
jgi:hypothetical protein